MTYTIKDLAEGRCAVINDGTLGELREVLRMAFPDYEITPYGDCKIYKLYGKYWIGADCTNLPTQSVKDFLKPSLSDKIEELKELAKSQGLECEVVVKEKKRIEVGAKLINHFCDSLVIQFDTGYVNPEKIPEFLAKQLEKYLNNEL